MRFMVIPAGVFVAAVLGNYWFNPYVPLCRLPVEYSIGTFDDRFGVSQTDALAALREAESIWETALDRDDIFSYDEDSRLKVNFIYGERQREAEAAEQARQDLSMRGDANDVLVELHKKLVEEYETQTAEHEARLKAYEQKLADYNAEVERYNQQGGAPPEVYARLQQTSDQLEAERRALNELSRTLNDLATQINSVGEKGNELVGEYNERVQDFNNSFAHGHEYTQGDYDAKAINVYSFVDREELVAVLAHELGHSLAIGHVDDPTALMYYLMKDQPKPPVLTEADKAAFRDACESGFGTRLLVSFSPLYNRFITYLRPTQ